MSNVKLFSLRNNRMEWLITLFSSSFATSASIALLVTSTWLIVTASLKPPILTLTVAVVSVRFFGISRGVFRYVERYSSHNLVLKEIQDLRIRLWQGLRQNLKNSFSNLNRSNAVNTLIRDLDGIQDIWLRALIPWISGSIVVAIIVSWISLVNWQAGLIFLITYLLAGVLIPYLINKISIKSTKKIPQARADLYSLTSQQFSSMSEIVTFNLQEESFKNFSKQNIQLVESENKKSFVSGLSSALILLITGLTIVYVYRFSVNLNLDNKLTAATIAIFTLISLGVFEILSMVPNSLQSWNQGNAAASRINQLSQISYNDNNILQKVELTIKSNDFVAIVGPSGSGKSTFLHSLIGLVEEKVSLTVDNFKLDSNLDIDSENNIYAVLNDSYLFDSSIKENLLMANPLADENKMWEALNKVSMKENIDLLDKKLDANVGQNGVNFSGGERQRLLLARIFLTSANIILIDEPTEHLDDDMSKKVFNSIIELSKQKTIIFITHKESEYSKASKIIRIEKGKIELN